MMGIFLIFSGSFFDEISSSLGKRTVNEHAQSFYSMGFLQMIGGLGMLMLISILRPSVWVFSWASLPTFAPRLILEILQLHVTLLAITAADRTTFSFIRALTIPMLLLTDVVLGYIIGPWQFVGIGIILGALAVSFAGRAIGRRGRVVALISALNAVATLSLYKYNITHFNSVAAEETIINLALVAYCLAQSYFRAGERPWLRLTQLKFLSQTVSSGASALLEAYSFLFAPASIILAAKRSGGVFWSTISGNVYFKEKHFFFKFAVMLALSAGMVLLAFGS